MNYKESKNWSFIPQRIRTSTVVSNRTDKKKKDKRKKKENKALAGKEVSNIDSASEGQIVYGQIQCGGSVTFIETSSDVKAYILTGDSGSQNQLIWTCNTSGAIGNTLTLKLILLPASGAISISYVGSVIEITLKSAAGVSQTTTSQLITAVRADVNLNNNVSIQKMDVNHNGLVGAMATTSFAYGGGTWLHQVVTLACHEMDRVHSLYLDGRQVTFGATPDARWGSGIWANKVFMAFEYGKDTQQAQPDLTNQLPLRWTSNHKMQGCAHVYLILVWDSNLFSEGYPELLFFVNGKPVYDPRTGQTAFTDSFGKQIGRNVALQVADFLNNSKFGFGISYSDIDTTALTNAANDCDVSVNLNPSGTESQFFGNGIFSTSQDKETTLLQLLAAMDGVVVREGTKWFIYAGIYRAPSVTLTEDDLRGQLTVTTHLSRGDSFNSVRGTFISPTANYNETDVPVVINNTYRTEDGLTIWEDVSLPHVTSSGQAQRLFKIMLERSRQGIIVTFPATIAALQNRVTDTIYLTLSRYGWSNKVFEITDYVFVEDEDGTLGVDLELRETAAGIYSWSNGEETIVDLSPNSNLPSAALVAAPTAVTLTSGTSELYFRKDGTVAPRIKVAWTVSTTEFVVDGGKYEIQFQRSDTLQNAALWSQSVTVTGGSTFAHIVDVEQIYYDVRIRALSALNYYSPWVYVLEHFCQGKSQPPNNVTGFIANISNLGIILNWDRSLEIDLAGYRIKRGTTTDWASGTLVEKLTTATQFQDNFRTVGSWYYLIKAVDTSANESTNVTSFLVIVNAPNPIAALDIKVTNNVVLIDWDIPLSTSFPIAKYRLYKGATFAGATLLGEAFVTFQAWTEQFAGSNSFWVTAVDTGGNESSAIGKYVTWFNPPNTIQYVYNAVDPSASDLSSAVLDSSSSFIAPVRVEDSWSQHFTRNGWATIAAKAAAVPTPFLSTPSGFSWIDPFTTYGWATIDAKVAAGYTIWIEPADTLPGLFTRTIDTGVIITGARIEVAFSQTIIHGSVTITTYIETSIDLATWVTFAEGLTALASTPFRWVRISIIMTGANDKSLVRVISPIVSVGVRKYSLSGRAITSAAGTATVSIGSDFLSVNSIQLTPSGGTGREVFPVFTYSTLNPTSFDVLGYIAGAPGAVDFVWTVEGSTGGI